MVSRISAVGWYLPFGLIIFLSMGCKVPQSVETIQSITLVTQSRGINDKFVIEKDQITCYKQEEVRYVHSQQGALDDFLAVMEVDAGELENLKTSKKLSASDRSPLASVIITSDKGEYQSAQFDYLNPPQVLRRLIRRLEKIDRRYD